VKRTAIALVAAAAVAGGACGGATQARPPRAVPAPSATTTTAPLFVEPPVVVEHGRRDRPDVALTFDSNLTDFMIGELDRGAVSSFYNAAVVDELERLAVPATFFLAGKWMQRYPDAVHRLASNPQFELGSHSYSHRAFAVPCYGLRQLDLADMAADVDASEALLRAATPSPTRYFRFPGGCYDEVALAGIAGTGVVVVQYDVASGDAFGRSVPAIVHHVLGSVRNGSIVVMHVTGGNTAPLTAEALGPIVNGLREQGFTLVRLSELLGRSSE
jgi:peptidoglycan/xylan/chitin deacetylase (PgdA/CDA1 family)